MNLSEIIFFFHHHHILFERNIPLKEYCTYRIGGPAEFIVFPEHPEQLRILYCMLRQENLRYFLLGGGSNLLFDDRGFRGLIISTSHLNPISTRNGQIWAQAGCSMDQLTHYAVDHSLSGIEFASGLPGSLGGAVYMNARCYGGEFSELIRNVTALNPDGEWESYTQQQCLFEYKNSLFQLNNAIILECHLNLCPAPSETIRSVTQANRDDRTRKKQFDFPSAGCIFKNNYTLGIPSGKLIEELGYKGLKRNDIEVYPHHANFFINHGNGKSEDVLYLIDLIKNEAERNYHITLQEEIIYVPY
jgi:UDP-N-acetylmuramate dehydrogenase